MKHQGPGHPGPETRESKRQQRRTKGTTEEKKEANKGTGKGQPQPGGDEQSRKTKRPKKKVRRTRTRPGGRPARPGQEGRAHTHTHGTWAWHPPTRKGRCWRPHETAPVYRPSPLSNDGRHMKPDASVTGSAHANPHSASSPRPTLEGSARDNPIAGPRTGTTRSEPSAPASAGVSGRHNEPSSRPASAHPAQPSSKAGVPSPRGGERHRGVGKADRSTERDRTGRGAAHHAGPRGTPERHAAGHNRGTRTGAKKRRPPGAADLESAHNTHERRHEKRCQATPAAVRLDECAPGGYPAPAAMNSRRPDRRVRAQERTQPLPATEQPPSGCTSARPEGT